MNKAIHEPTFATISTQVLMGTGTVRRNSLNALSTEIGSLAEPG